MTESVELATILLTDLVGSTRLATSVGPVRADELREEHFDLLRDAIASSSGREVQNTGDGLMVAFASASAAVECAVAIQQLFERRYRGADQTLHVRIGLGAGESTVRDGDYFGMPSIEAARLCAEAPTDGILISAAVKMFAGRLFLWGKITPPTPVYGYMPLLQLLDGFAKGRGFFADDPRATLERQGISPGDFKVQRDWDAYPVAGFLLEIWDATEAFVTTVVRELYKTDDEVKEDQGLKAWIQASVDSARGNIQGLAPPKTRDELTEVLTSLLYRVTAHGASSLTPSVNPTLSFVATMPPCLQSDKIPAPSAKVSEKELLALLPHTGSLGAVINFYFTFAYTKPFVPFIPPEGVRTNPYFPPQQKGCNEALFSYRQRIHDFVDEYVAEWNLALERLRGWAEPPPKYAQDQYPQWARSIEI